MPPVAEDLSAAIERGDRRALARAITLVESTRPDHRRQAAQLLEELLGRTGGAIRVGISGPPGAGKSTFIERLGLFLLEQGHRVAVLAVDPSSRTSRGSILGDKTRMELLARQSDAYIRPSPSGGALGGVAPRTREALLVCEAFGFDVVIVETVGVGQSEVEVEGMVDTFVLLLSPGGGDELQGVKRGVMELADVVVVTKADGELLAAAQHAASDYRTALHLMRPRVEGWTTPVCLCSALEGRGLPEAWAAVTAHAEAVRAAGVFEARRREQSLRWMWTEVHERLLARFDADPAVATLRARLEDDVASGRTSPTHAAEQLLAAHRVDAEPPG